MAAEYEVIVPTPLPKPQVYNKKTDRIPPGAIYIGRGSRWGNPYVIGINGDRNAVIQMYKHEVENASSWLGPRPGGFPTIKEIQERLRGKNLVCFCAPAECHGDYLLEVANGPCVNCSNGVVPTKGSQIAADNVLEAMLFEECPVCKGDARQ